MQALPSPQGPIPSLQYTVQLIGFHHLPFLPHRVRRTELKYYILTQNNLLTQNAIFFFSLFFDFLFLDNRHYNEDGYRLPRGLKTQKGLFLRKNAGTEAAISETTASLEVALRKHLNQLYEMQPSIEDCLQTASSVLLDIFSSPDSPSKDAWRKAARGVRLLEDGLSFLTEAKNLLS